MCFHPIDSIRLLRPIIKTVIGSFFFDVDEDDGIPNAEEEDSQFHFRLRKEKEGGFVGGGGGLMRNDVCHRWDFPFVTRREKRQQSIFAESGWGKRQRKSDDDDDDDAAVRQDAPPEF